MRGVGAALVLSLLVSSSAFAQQAPPPIGPFVVDVRLSIPNLPNDSAQLATSRGLALIDLPNRGLGFEIGGQYYLFKWRAMTIGVGGSFFYTSGQTDPIVPVPTTPPVPTPSPTPTAPGVIKPPQFAGYGASEQFTTFAPQVSFNFGSGLGWSYISGGVGLSLWPLVPGTQLPTPADEAQLKTINYGGGGRWFKKKHVAFTFDVRFYAINPGIPNGPLGLSPRTTLLVIGAGVSLK